MARRMAGVGRVTVSLRRSTTLTSTPPDCSSRSGSVTDCVFMPFSQGVASQLAHQFDERFIRNAQAFRRQTNDGAGALNQARCLQGGEALIQIGSVRAFQTCQVDSFELSETEKQFLIERPFT